MNKLEATFALVFVFIAYLFTGTQDYNIAKAAEQEKKSAAHEARIWSQRCSKRGLQVYATQADGGKWVVRCAKATVMVKA